MLRYLRLKYRSLFTKKRQYNFPNNIAPDDEVAKQRYDAVIMTHPCQFCDAVLLSGVKRRLHEAQTHNYKPTSYKCRFCDRVFDGKQNRDKHENVHIGMRPFNCRRCGRAFSSKQNCESHEKVESVHLPRKCKQCDESFDSLYSLLVHEVSVHNRKSVYRKSKFISVEI